jgi:hypothetical protein
MAIDKIEGDTVEKGRFLCNRKKKPSAYGMSYKRKNDL